MKKNETYEHLYVGEGRVTLAILSNEEVGRATVGVAFCSPKDRFVRAKGRLIAKGRAQASAHLSYNFSMVNNSYIDNKLKAVDEFGKWCLLNLEVTEIPVWAADAIARGEVCTVKELKEIIRECKV